MRDQFGREITYLRVSVTDRCNLRCVYCMPAEGVTLLSHDQIISFERIADIARAAAGLGFTKIRLTGGEPLVRRGFPELVSLLRAIPGIETLAMTTNGVLLAPAAAELHRRGLDSVNISLDTLDPERYAALTRGGRITDVLAGIEAARLAGFPMKINTVVLEETSTGELAELSRFCESVGACHQLIRRYSLSGEKTDDDGYDRPPRCGECNRIRLLANGILRPCLHSNLEFPVDFADIEGSIRRCVMAKPGRGSSCTDLSVGQIGG